MRLLLQPLVFVIVASLGFSAGTAPRPNFVMIAVDDLNYFTSAHLAQPDNFLRKIYPTDARLAEVGRRLTPNLQRLANQSMIFTRAYCTSALCGPSRTSLLSGVPPHVSGYYQHNEHFRFNPKLKDVVTLPQYLKANGYFTTGLGKVFHKQMPEQRERVRHDWPDSEHSWSQWVNRRIGANADRNNAVNPGGVPGDTRPARTLSPYSPADGLFSFGHSVLKAEDTFDFQNAQFAAGLIRRGKATCIDGYGQPTTVTLPADQPFFIALGLFMPHLPWVVPPEFIARFPVEEMEINEALVRWVTDDITDLPNGTARQWLGQDFDTLVQKGEELHGPGGVTHAWKAALQHYLGSIAFADHCLGQVLDALEASAQRDHTVVLLWGDHGWNLGDKRRFRKQSLWEGANHTAFLWRDPAARSGHSGVPCNQLVSLQDIYPTIAARAGLPIPAHVHGRNLAPLLADAAAPGWENELLMTYNAGNHAVRTATHRYIHYADGGRELYDLRSDPFELINLAGQSRHEAEETALAARLGIHLERTAGESRR